MASIGAVFADADAVAVEGAADIGTDAWSSAFARVPPALLQAPSMAASNHAEAMRA
ncbi:MAG: hypothetical protein QM719_07520 [Thermomonas sp.]